MKRVEIIKLKEHDVTISYEGGMFLLWSETFQEYAYEPTVEKLMSSYIESLKCIVLEYGTQDNSVLSSDAIELKERINRIIEYNIIEE